MKIYGGVELQLHALLTSTVDGGEWLASRLGCFTPIPLGWHRSQSGSGCEVKNLQISFPYTALQGRKPHKSASLAEFFER